METNNFTMENFLSNSRKLELVESNIQDNYLIQCLVFNKTIIPLTL